MYLKYNDYIGQLIHYEKLDSERIRLVLLTTDNIELRFTCKDSDITIPNVMGNAKILYEIDKQRTNDSDKK